METVRGKVVRKGKDAKGRPRKFVEIPEQYDDLFDFGDLVRLEKVQKNAPEQES